MDMLRHLRYFVTVADERHFGRAATVLEMTQPPLSQGVRRLERHLGVPLLNRTPAGVSLTAEGTALLPRARLALSEVELLEDHARALVGSRGAIRWGADPALADRWVAGCAAELGRRVGSGTPAPVSTICAPTTELIDRVRDRGLDAAVVVHPALVDGVRARPVVRLPRSLVVPAGHPAASAGRLTARMLADLLPAGPPRSANPPAFDAWCDIWRERGLVVDEVVAAADDRAVLAAVASGRCFGAVAGTSDRIPGVDRPAGLRAEVSLRVRVIGHPDVADDILDALDRVLFRERIG